MRILVSVCLLLLASSSPAYAGTSSVGSYAITLKHATDCRANITNAKQDQICIEQDDGKMWQCKAPGTGGSATDCDQTAEWQQIGGGAPECGAIPCVAPNDAVFSWVAGTQGSSTIDTSTPGSVLLQTGTGASLSYALRSIAAPSVPYTRTVWLDTVLRGANNSCLFGVRDSGTGTIQGIYLFATASAINMYVGNFTNPTTWSTNPATSVAVFPLAPLSVAFQINDDATNRTFRWGINNLDFVTLYTIGRTNHVANPNELVWGCTATSASLPAVARMRHYQ